MASRTAGPLLAMAAQSSRTAVEVQMNTPDRTDDRTDGAAEIKGADYSGA
jgi:hypothetical protein